PYDQGIVFTLGSARASVNVKRSKAHVDNVR
ncbi:hypothetical protein LCGC14_3118550, partial [marine sediment metagenome]